MLAINLGLSCLVRSELDTMSLNPPKGNAVSLYGTFPVIVAIDQIIRIIPKRDDFPVLFSPTKIVNGAR